tara:strand:+ start:224 stop:841 length:618 start_codon:yes stop_codon:yes gene_type:complete
MYRIFINENLLILSSLESKVEIDEMLEVHYYSGVESITEAIKRVRISSLTMVGVDLEVMWRDFCSHFEQIDAAGGVIINENRDILWIFRNGKWDLPKGKVENEESTMDAAIREVEEECSVHDIRLGPFLSKTYHIYEYNGQSVLKSSYWYGMTCSREQSLKPQIEEGITKVIWADAKQHRKCLANTYSSISELLKREKVLHYLHS